MRTRKAELPLPVIALIYPQATKTRPSEDAVTSARIGVCVWGLTFLREDENGMMLASANEKISLPVAASPTTSSARIENTTTTTKTSLATSPIQYATMSTSGTCEAVILPRSGMAIVNPISATIPRIAELATDQ